MSVPYGQPPAAPQSGPSSSRGGGLDLGGILALAGLVLGLIIYFCNFSVSALGFSSPLLYFFLVAALLGAGALLPKAPATLVPAAVLAMVGTLGTLNAVVLVDPPPIVILILVLGVLQTAALVGAVLVDTGMIKTKPKGVSFPGQQWGSSGSFQTQPGQYSPSQYGPAGQYGPAQPAPSGQPGQYGQPSQQPPPNQYEQETAQFSQPWSGGSWKSGDYGRPGEQLRPDEGESGRQGEGEPGRQGPNPPPGTSPGGARGPDRS
ncbi:MAG: DUF5336 domain-containing protein [Actinomycetota bacterium]|nr:DUF5336 domain-containing protein [Actinomycetota bacterium]